MRNTIQLVTLLLSNFGWVWWLSSSLFLLLIFFILAELEFIVSIFQLGMPVPVLWELTKAFLTDNTVHPIGHFVLIALLGGFYLNTLRYILLSKHYVSRGSFLTSALGYLGVSVGLSCLGCGAAYLALLLSFFGVSSSLLLITAAQPYLLLLGELTLLVSIILVLRSLRSFVR